MKNKDSFAGQNFYQRWNNGDVNIDDNEDDYENDDDDNDDDCGTKQSR